MLKNVFNAENPFHGKGINNGLSNDDDIILLVEKNVSNVLGKIIASLLR